MEKKKEKSKKEPKQLKNQKERGKMCLLEDGWEHQCYSFRIEISDATEGHCRPTLTEMLAEIAWCGEFCPMSHPELMGLLVISEMMWFEKVYRENSSGWLD